MRSRLPPPTYQEPPISFFDIILGRKARLLNEATEAYERSRASWEADDLVNEERFRAAKSARERREQSFWDDHTDARDAFMVEQASRNKVIDDLKAAVARGEQEAVVEHTSLVLDGSDYQGIFDKKFVVQYSPSDKLVMIAYDLLICPPLSGPETMIVWTTKGTTDAIQEAQAGRDYRQAA